MLTDPQLPPMFTGHPIKAPDRVLASACSGATLGTLGAGDFVWARNTTQVECALVLEPEVGLGRALQMAVVMEVALAEALGSVCPPQVAVEFRWPGLILVNGGVAGAIQLAAPRTDDTMLDFDQIPAWLVIAMSLDLKHPDRRGEPGDRADRTSLFEEGAGDVDRNALLEALAPRLLAWIHTWQEDGFRPIHEQWLFRAEGRASAVNIDGINGRIIGRDESVGLVFKSTDEGVRILPYHSHIAWDGIEAGQ
jgi:BirA family transcriptional regulator, biotin operon repressor / biotin---[acetyl-CoA-carboxylase] ligase